MALLAQWYTLAVLDACKAESRESLEHTIKQPVSVTQQDCVSKPQVQSPEHQNQKQTKAERMTGRHSIIALFTRLLTVVLWEFLSVASMELCCPS